jgi:hypothetical protein
VRESDASAELAEREGLVGKLCLANTLRGRLRWRDGDWHESARMFTRAHAMAERGLGGALAICERAGLIPQSVQANAALALTCALAGELPRARAAAEQAALLAERVHDPVGEAAALEARGVVGALPEALESIRSARTAWERLGRPLEVAGCELLLGRRLREHDPQDAGEVLARAAILYDGLGVAHLAAEARELAGGDAGERQAGSVADASPPAAG